jgi:rare lipoprotein A
MQLASADDRLEGGSDTSYGYGAQNRGDRGAVIDLRRPGGRVTPVTSEPSVPLVIEADDEGDDDESDEAEQGEEGAAPFLERERVGPPYQAGGQWFVPTPEPGYSENGTASWYGQDFQGRRTASGETFDQDALTAAHPTLPIPSLVQVTNLDNGREVIVRVNDRGPFAHGRLIDLSRGAARVLDFETQGQARVHVRYLGPAPRRVNADGSMAPASPPSPAVNPVAEEREEGPRSLLPPSSTADQTGLAGAPVVGAPVYAAAPSYSAPAAVAGGYYVQIGAFSDLANAHRVRDAVGAAGPVVVDVRRSSSGGELFRVRVGPWNSAAEADAARRVVASLGYGESIVAAR